MPLPIRFALLCIFIAATGACGDESGPPTAPTTTSATRIIGLNGSLGFGNVELGSSVERTLTITNTGNSTLTVSGITVSTSAGGAAFVMSWTSGTIAAGASQSVTVRLTPTEARSYDGTLSVAADHTSGTNTIVVTGLGVAITQPPPPPKTTFGAGTYAVNTDIAAGRYFSTPAFGCYWERLSGLGNIADVTIASEFIGDIPGQWIVDVAADDRYFRANPECGTWVKDAPRRGLEPTITAGVWLVGSQVNVGAYRSTVGSGCSWQRLSGFGNKGTDEIIDSKFIEAAGLQSIEIKAGDVGFRTNSDCGTWSPVSPILAPAAPLSSANGRSPGAASR